MASRNVQYVRFYKLDYLGRPKTLGIFVPELEQIGQNLKAITSLLKQVDIKVYPRVGELLKNIKANPRDFKSGYISRTEVDQIQAFFTDTHNKLGFYSTLSSAKIPLPGNIQESEMPLHYNGKLPEGIFSEVSHFHVKYQHQPSTKIEEYLPKVGYGLAAITALGLALLVAQGVVTGGLAMGLLFSVFAGTLMSRYTHILGVAQNKLSRLGLAYSRFASGLYRDQTWGKKTDLLQAGLTTSTFLTGVLWGATKFFEASLKLFNYPVAILYTGASLLYNMASVLDPVWASFGLYKTRPVKKFALETIKDRGDFDVDSDNDYGSDNEYDSDDEDKYHKNEERARVLESDEELELLQHRNAKKYN